MFGQFFNPAQVVPNPSADQQKALEEGWKGFFSNPDNQSALMAFGAQLLQPLAPGQNLLGRIGEGLGKAGETLDNRAKTAAERAREANDVRLREEENEIRRQQMANQQSQFDRSLEVDWFNAKKPSGASGGLDPDTMANLAQKYESDWNAARTSIMESLDAIQAQEDSEAGRAAQARLDAQLAALGPKETYVGAGLARSRAAAGQGYVPNVVELENGTVMTQDAYDRRVEERRTVVPKPDEVEGPPTLPKPEDSTQSGDVVAKPDPAPAPTPTPDPAVKPLTMGALFSSDAERGSTIRAMGRSGDPERVARARLWYAGWISRLADPAVAPTFEEFLDGLMEPKRRPLPPKSAVLEENPSAIMGF